MMSISRTLLAFMLIVTLAETASGLTGNALYFDGTNDVATIADHPSLRFADSFTLEAWVRPGVTGSVALMNRWNVDTPVSSHWIFEVFEGRLWLFFASAWHGGSGPLVEAGRWTHVAITVSPW